MKRCSTCGELKEENHFNWRNKEKGRKWGTCKECQRSQRKDWYERNKQAHIANVRETKKRMIAQGQQYIWDYLSIHPCVDCGESNPIVLEFDHISGQKRKAVGDLARQGYSIAAIEEEIAKCVVRCANCHRIKTHRERGWFRG
jgi:hypothetical protein